MATANKNLRYGTESCQRVETWKGLYLTYLQWHNRPDRTARGNKTRWEENVLEGGQRDSNMYDDSTAAEVTKGERYKNPMGLKCHGKKYITWGNRNVRHGKERCLREANMKRVQWHSLLMEIPPEKIVKEEAMEKEKIGRRAQAKRSEDRQPE